MSTETTLPTLASLTYIPYIDSNGNLPAEFQAKIGVYAVFDREQILKFVGFSRDISLSLKQHLVRQPQSCYWLKYYTIDRPSRTILDQIRAAWIAENGNVPTGNDIDAAKWNDPIDVKLLMTEEERSQLENQINESAQAKFLKSLARRMEDKIFAELAARGVNEEIHFNPKLKESGLLDLK